MNENSKQILEWIPVEILKEIAVMFLCENPDVIVKNLIDKSWMEYWLERFLEGIVEEIPGEVADQIREAYSEKSWIKFMEKLWKKFLDEYQKKSSKVLKAIPGGICWKVLLYNFWEEIVG